MRTKTTASVGKKVTAALLALSMALGGGGLPLAPSVALADVDKTVESLGTAAITVPTSGGWTKDGGSYVWYGTAPARYRVLANGTTAFSSDGSTKTMLLDCDEIPLTGVKWDASGLSNAWAGSGVKGKASEFLATSLTELEQGAVAESSTTQGKDPEKSEKGVGGDFKLTGEKAFVLSVGEANTYYADKAVRKKTGGSGLWWLRSAGTSPNYPCAAGVYDDGSVSETGLPVDGDLGELGDPGVSPAFNVDLSSVIFSSKVSDREYKLTLKDATLAASGTATLDGTTATVTYTTDGGRQASWLVTDKAWDADGAQVLGYGRLGGAGAGKTGSFDLTEARLSEGAVWGTDYHVYVLAEDVNDGNLTDCASAPAELDKPAAAHKVTVTNDGHGTASANLPEATEGDVVTLTATPAEGYEFERWTVDGAGASIDDATSPKATLTMGTADATVTATFRKKAEPKPQPADVPPVSVTAHVQRKGSLPAVSGGAIAGTTGKSLRLESLKLTVPGASATGGIEYRSHVQGKGWEKSYARDGERSGTEGKAKRLEAVKIRLWGDMRDKYDVWYRVHSQKYGWMAWAKNGERAGTQGKAFRAEAIQVVLVAKDGPAPDATFQGATQTCAKAFVKK